MLCENKVMAPRTTYKYRDKQNHQRAITVKTMHFKKSHIHICKTVKYVLHLFGYIVHQLGCHITISINIHTKATSNVRRS